jgi:hypothetical protein
MHVVHTIGTLALWTALGAALLFCLLYHLSAPWWRSAEGRHLMSFTGGLGLVFGWLAYRSVTTAPGDAHPAEETARTCVYLSLAVLLLWRLGLLWRRQIHPALRRRERKDGG